MEVCFSWFYAGINSWHLIRNPQYALIEPITGMIDNIPKRGSIWYLTDIDYVLYKADLHFNHIHVYVHIQCTGYPKLVIKF